MYVYVIFFSLMLVNVCLYMNDFVFGWVCREEEGMCLSKKCIRISVCLLKIIRHKLNGRVDPNLISAKCFGG